MKHTKGPWFFEDDKHNTHKWIFSQATGYVIARFEHDEINLEANAHLIAAAPDLLSACEAALIDLCSDELFESHKETINTLQSALKKARGES